MKSHVSLQIANFLKKISILELYSSEHLLCNRKARAAAKWPAKQLLQLLLQSKNVYKKSCQAYHKSKFGRKKFRPICDGEA